MRIVGLLCVAALLAGAAMAAEKCKVSCVVTGLEAKNHRTLGNHIDPTENACHAGKKGKYPVPDHNCTPGAINPSVTVDVLNNPNFRTCCLRDKVESEEAKKVAYKWYGIQEPQGNKGNDQVCELDHLVPLELGGGDSMDNIWPQCGPDNVTLKERYFKQKDQVEQYLATQVRSGQMDLAKAQRAIAADYTQFLDAAKAYCASHPCE